MRWEKLFADLESQGDEDALNERDALIADLRQGEQAATSWQDLCGGDLRVVVTGLGRVEGIVLAVNPQLLHVRSTRADLLINPAAVLELIDPVRRSEPQSIVASRLGWPAAFRLTQRDQDRITVHRLDGSMRVGLVTAVGRDFVQLGTDSGGRVVIPFAAIAAVSCPR